MHRYLCGVIRLKLNRCIYASVAHLLRLCSNKNKTRKTSAVCVSFSCFFYFLTPSYISLHFIWRQEKKSLFIYKRWNQLDDLQLKLFPTFFSLQFNSIPSSFWCWCSLVCVYVFILYRNSHTVSTAFRICIFDSVESDICFACSHACMRCCGVALRCCSFFSCRKSFSFRTWHVIAVWIQLMNKTNCDRYTHGCVNAFCSYYIVLISRTLVFWLDMTTSEKMR